MRTFIFVVILLFNFSSVEARAATSAKKVCVNSTGVIAIKSKCKKGEKLLSALTLNQTISVSPEAAGPIGPQGAIGIQGEIGPIGTGLPGIQGVQGIKGVKGQIDLSACRITTAASDSNFFNFSNAILYAEVFCSPSTEFILEDESKVSFFPGSEGTRVALQGRSTYTQNIGGDVRDYGVGIYANRFLTVGTGAFQFSVRAVCCPR